MTGFKIVVEKFLQHSNSNPIYGFYAKKMKRVKKKISSNKKLTYVNWKVSIKQVFQRKVKSFIMPKMSRNKAN